MRKLSFGQFAIVFGVCGIALLYVVTVLSEPVLVHDFKELENLEGETVSVEGTVLCYQITGNGELYYTIYNDKKVVDIVIENNMNVQDITEINFILKVTGEVQKNYRGDIEIVVTEISNIQVLGKDDPDPLTWTDFSESNETYIKAEGTVIGTGEYYNYQKLLLQNNSNKIEVILTHPSSNIGVGDIIELNGIIKKSKDDYRMYVYSPEAVKVTGFWQVSSIGLDQLIEAPEKYLDFPINVQGYVRYEPWTNPAYSFYLSDNNINSEVSLRVDLSDMDSSLNLHKGDIVNIISYTVFDENSMRFLLKPMSIEIKDRYGTWETDIDDLAENVIDYERALLNLTGYLYSTDNNFYLGNRAVKDNCTVLLKIVPNITNSSLISLNNLNNSLPSSNPVGLSDSFTFSQGSKVSLLGRLELFPEHFSHQFTLEPDPNCFFWFPYFG